MDSFQTGALVIIGIAFACLLAFGFFYNRHQKHLADEKVRQEQRSLQWQMENDRMNAAVDAKFHFAEKVERDAKAAIEQILHEKCVVTDFSVKNGTGANRGALVIKANWTSIGGAKLYLFKNADKHFQSLDVLLQAVADENVTQVLVVTGNEPLEYVDTEVESGKSYNYYVLIAASGKMEYSNESPDGEYTASGTAEENAMCSFQGKRESVRAIESETDYLRRQEERLNRRHNVWVLRQRELETQVKKVASKQDSDDFMKNAVEILETIREAKARNEKLEALMSTLNVTAEEQEELEARLMRLAETVD